MITTKLNFALISAVEADLIAVITSEESSLKEKADACRELGTFGSKESVEPLVKLLADERYSHMARYGLEPNPDPSVDEALRDALGKFKGLPLVGVIGSAGVRRDEKAVGALANLLKDENPQVSQAAARALGDIGNPEAAKALEGALADTCKSNHVAFCEGLFRCAEALEGCGKTEEAQAAFDCLRGLKDAPQQVRAGALRASILIRKEKGLPLMLEALRGDDYVLVGAALRAAQEIACPSITKPLMDELGSLPTDKQILVINTLAKRADPAVLPALFEAAKSGEKAVRLEAIRALPEIGDAKAVPVLKELLNDPDPDIKHDAESGLSAL